MNKEDKEMVLWLIEKQQKEQTSLLELSRKDESKEYFILQDDKHMVDFCERSARKYLRILQIRQDMIKDLALLVNLRTIKLQNEMLLEDQVIKTKAGVFIKGLCMGLQDKARNVHERRMCSRD